jgi:thermitase
MGKLIFILAVSVLFQARAEAQEGQFIVKFKEGVPMGTDAPSGWRKLGDHEAGHWQLWSASPAVAAGGLGALRKRKEVEYVVPNEKVKNFLRGSNEVSVRAQWALEMIRIGEAWALAGIKGSRSVTVAVIDTGADYRHLALAPNMVKGFNFIANNDDPMDVVDYGFPGHGTHCSGVVGATGLRSNGTAGVAPEISLMPLKFIDTNGGDISNAVRAIDFAIEKKVSVISASWGGRMPPAHAQPLVEAIRRAEEAGILFVTAAGNEGSNNEKVEVYPANIRVANAITVAGTNQLDRQTDWSNYSTYVVDLGAPGESILSTLPGNRYASMSGTSMSTPHVAGVAALLRSLDASLNPAQVKALLLASGQKNSMAVVCGCRLDAAAAVKRVKEQELTVVPQGALLIQGNAMKFESLYGRGTVRFRSLRPDIVSVNEKGEALALSPGDAFVEVVDEAGRVAKSMAITVRTP